MQLLGNQEQGGESLVTPRPGHASTPAQTPDVQLLIIEVAGVRCALPVASVIGPHLAAARQSEETAPASRAVARNTEALVGAD